MKNILRDTRLSQGARSSFFQKSLSYQINLIRSPCEAYTERIILTTFAASS